MISARNLDFSYPHGFALRIGALCVARGERVAVVGPSGTGKTTLLNLVAGIVRPASGRLEVAGHDLTRLSDRARRAFRAAHVGFVFQDFALMDYLTARQNILYPFRITGRRPDRAARDRAETLAEASGIGDRLDRRPARLSHGERQRVAICRALIGQPDVLLADEATGNLDPENKTAILDLLFARASEADAALLAVTHDHALLPRFDRVIDFAEFRR